MTRLLIADLITAATEVTGVCRAKLVGPSRLGPISRVRQMIYLLATAQGHTLAVIGERMGGIDHSSVSAGRARARSLMVDDPEFAGMVAEIECRARALVDERCARVARMLVGNVREAA